MKKILSIVIVGIIVISGLGAVALPESKSIPEKIEFVEEISQPFIEEKEEYIFIDFEESTSFLIDEGKPMIPVKTETFTFPAGTKINNIDVDVSTTTYVLDKKIEPSPLPVRLSDEVIPQEAVNPIPDKSVYESYDLYPSESYEIRKGIGLKDGELSLYVNIDCYARYSPMDDTIYVPSEIDLKIDYIKPQKSFIEADEYDLLIITDESFVNALQPLVEHKNNHGIRTIVDTVQNIYASYDGRTDPENIKLRIKDAKEELGIIYVILAGGRKGQTNGWYVPEFATNNDDGAEGGYSSDLYYADLYKDDNGDIVFDDWDSNKNGVFAEFGGFMKLDKMDFYPDVVIGRLPFRTLSDVEVVVDKIIDYENNADDSWFKRAVVAAGDTFPPSRGGSRGWWEGILETGITVNHLESAGFEVDKLWLSIPGAWEGSDDVTNAFNEGAGFVHFAGHGNPAAWGNHPPDDEDHVYVQGFQLRDMKNYKNDGMLPIVIIGGCHNAQFNVTMANILPLILEYGFRFFTYYMYLMQWVPRDGASWYLLEEGGGTIATMGCTGYGYGYVDDGWDQGLGGWIEPRFFDAYTNQSKDILGEAHDQAIIDYINIIGNVNKG